MDTFWASLIVAGLALIGTLVGHLVTHRGNTRSNERTAALIAYRLEQLEMKVEAHNNLVERMYCVEGQVSVVARDVTAAHARIKNLEERK